MTPTCKVCHRAVSEHVVNTEFGKLVGEDGHLYETDYTFLKANGVSATVGRPQPPKETILPAPKVSHVPPIQRGDVALIERPFSEIPLPDALQMSQD